MIDDRRREITQRWVRNRSDELAVTDGCYFDAKRAAWAIWWIEYYCRLYEGEWAGEHVLLRSGCDEVDQQVLADWDEGGCDLSLQRLETYSQWWTEDCGADWQYECIARLFGWVKYSQRWSRVVRRFNQASIWVPKKQKKSPTLAAVGVYLTCGDGEQGGKTFGGAKDGNQAGISMAHALAMIEQSPKLSSECKINRNEKSITHGPTRSLYKPLSSANERTKNSKEGINGNILIDETHVVDRDFIDIISRAGISRVEPLHIEVSTAGNNPDGYGKERQDYARQVEAGATQNNQLFVAIYEAPQDLTDDELATDPVKYGQMANPAWGHTAHEEEFLADYDQSRRSITALAQFKMYRLNIWQRTANQWLKQDDWLACGQAIAIEDFEGRPAACGLDLSKTRDMSALAICIPHDGITSLFCRLWMTEEYATKNSDKAQFAEWAASGALTLIPGGTIQESFIRVEFEKLCKLLDVKVLVKDKWYAEDFTEWCEEKYRKVLQVDYPQSYTQMEKPIDDFEAAVIEGDLQHENNACLNWQAGHAAVAANARGCRMIQKPKPNDIRKVDGMVAAAMAYWGCKQLPKRDSVYKRRGVLCA